jgi:hypothetical protein
MTDMTDKKGLLIEENIINSIKSLLTGWVNELLGEVEFLIPPIEFTHKPNEGFSLRPSPPMAVSFPLRIYRLENFPV